MPNRAHARRGHEPGQRGSTRSDCSTRCACWAPWRSLQKQSDVQLVKEGTPAYILLLDGLVESAPDNPKLLLAAADANTAYAVAFVDKSETERARALYAKARDYGTTVLCRNKKFEKSLKGPIGRNGKHSRRSRRSSEGSIAVTSAVRPVVRATWYTARYSCSAMSLAEPRSLPRRLHP